MTFLHGLAVFNSVADNNLPVYIYKIASLAHWKHSFSRVVIHTTAFGTNPGYKLLVIHYVTFPPSWAGSYIMYRLVL